VQKTIAAGVPLVAVPFGRDQPEVARRVTEAHAGVAVPLKHLGAERLKQAVRAARAMDVRGAAERLRAAGGAERFADAAEELVGGAGVLRPRKLAQGGAQPDIAPHHMARWVGPPTGTST
jgi:UDP:flavonoid glycosyltransferase YjiC (YdhE family)